MRQFQQFLLEGRNDPAIFKAIFLAGGPASGKSTAIRKSGITGLGYRIVNSDQFLTLLTKKAGIDQDFTNKEDGTEDPKIRQIRMKSYKLNDKKLDLYIKGRLGLIIDGTGSYFPMIRDQSNNLRDIGYDTFMIFIKTPLDVAQQRNIDRYEKEGDRKLDPEIVSQSWWNAMANEDDYKTHFGRSFISMRSDTATSMDYAKVYKQVQKFTKKPIRNPQAKLWLKHG